MDAMKNGNIYMLLELTDDDIADLELSVYTDSDPDVRWEALKPFLRPGVVAVPAKFAADLTELSARVNERACNKDYGSLWSLAQRLSNAVFPIAPAKECDEEDCYYCNVGFHAISLEEWNRRPRTPWEAAHPPAEPTGKWF